MISTSIALYYSKAFFNLGMNKEQLENCVQALDEIAHLMESKESFRQFLLRPFVDPNIKKNLLKKLFQDKENGVAKGNDEVVQKLLNFLFLLLDKKRIRFLPAIAKEYRKLVNDHLGRLDLEVVTAVPIENAMKEKIKQSFEKSSRKEVLIREKIAPEVLGGIVLKIGNQVMDGSLKTQLDHLKDNLLAVTV